MVFHQCLCGFGAEAAAVEQDACLAVVLHGLVGVEPDFAAAQAAAGDLQHIHGGVDIQERGLFPMEDLHAIEGQVLLQRHLRAGVVGAAVGAAIEMHRKGGAHLTAEDIPKNQIDITKKKA